MGGWGVATGGEGERIMNSDNAAWRGAKATASETEKIRCQRLEKQMCGEGKHLEAGPTASGCRK